MNKTIEIIRKLEAEVKYRDDIIGLSPDGDRHAHLVKTIEKLKTNWSDLREEILHDSELDNDTINHVLGIIDSYDA